MWIAWFISTPPPAAAQHASQRTAVEQIPECAGVVVVAVLEADAEHGAALLGELGQALAVVESVGEGLLQQHRDVPGEALGRQIGVPMVRSADVHHVGGDRVEHRRQVGEAGAACPGGSLGTATLVDIADADRLDATIGARDRVVEDRVEVDLGDVAAADEGDPQAFAVVIKLGARGALALTGDQIVTAAPQPIDVVDPVGAGDAFVAGYLSGLVQDAPVADCLRRGNQLGGAVCRVPGDWEGLPTPEELDHLDSAMEDVVR